METKTILALALKSMTEAGTFEGKLATYGNIDEVGDVCDYGCMTKTLKEGGAQLPLCWQHDTSQPIGTLTLTDTPQALLCKGKLVLSVPAARSAYDLVREGVVKGLSIGYTVMKHTMEASGVRRLKEVRLFEGSLVTLAANPLAQITGVKQLPDTEALEAFRNAARDIKDFHRRVIDGN